MKAIQKIFDIFQRGIVKTNEDATPPSRNKQNVFSPASASRAPKNIHDHTIKKTM